MRGGLYELVVNLEGGTRSCIQYQAELLLYVMVSAGNCQAPSSNKGSTNIKVHYEALI